tara:strand:- start:300 stop:1268 length:969 start_codon:yes stop_codon:yes gene_type:complete
MPEELRKEEPMIDVGETDGAEIDLEKDNSAPEPKEELQVEESTDSGEETKTEEETKEEAPQKEELEQYSEGVKKRIAKLTRKMREAERQKEEAITYAKSIADQQKKLQDRYQSLDTNYVSEFENRVKSNLEAAKIKLKSAIDTQDVDGQIAAQTEIAALTMDAARLNQVKSQKPEEPKQIEQPVEQQQGYANAGQLKQAAQQMDPKAEEWASKNTWFGTDNAMTYTAFDIHKKLTEEEGYDPSSEEYYQEVDKRIRLEFPHKFGTTENTTQEKPSQTVASAKRPGTVGRRKTVKLTPSQVAIAKRLGVPLEEYAKQLVAKEA